MQTCEQMDRKATASPPRVSAGQGDPPATPARTRPGLGPGKRRFLQTSPACRLLAALGWVTAGGWPGIATGLLVSNGCGGDDRPPPAPGRDGAILRDAMGSDSGGGDAGGGGGRRDGGPDLPDVDLELILPFGGAPITHEFSVRADPGRLDVHLSIDTTLSFDGEIDAMQSTLRADLIPALVDAVPDVALGVSRFEDFPVAPYGETGDTPFRLLTAITTDHRRVASAVAALDDPLGRGGDIPEAGAEALFQIATGEGLRIAGRTHVAPFNPMATPGGGIFGGVGFRAGALHTVVHVTDAPSHSPDDYLPELPGTHDLSDAIIALRAVNARVLGIASGDAARGHLEAVAVATGAVADPVGGNCATGIEGQLRPALAGRCPLVFDVNPDGTGLSHAITEAILSLLATVEFDEVLGRAVGDRARFVQHIAALGAVAPRDREPPVTADRHPAGDGVDDTFVAVVGGTELTFRATFRNRLIPPADYDQVFHFEIEILGDGLTLSRLRIGVIVPRGRLDAGGIADAGAHGDAGPPRDSGGDAGGATDGAIDAAAAADGAVFDAGPRDGGP